MINCTFEDGGSATLRHAVADTLVIKDGKILLVKRAGKLLEAGKWGLAGGYAERDETMAQTAAREVLEETGWQVRNLRLLTINDLPDRPKEDRQNVAFVYICDAVEKTGQPDWESDEIRWFDLAELPANDQLAFDHAADIELYKKYLEEGIALPILN